MYRLERHLLKQSAPRPCKTLIARMAISAVSVALSPDRKDNQKSVDKTKYDFKKRFSGAATEDWMEHIDALELDRAKKHKWTATIFFYALKDTLSGAALKEFVVLQKVCANPIWRNSYLTGLNAKTES